MKKSEQAQENADADAWKTAVPSSIKLTTFCLYRPGVGRAQPKLIAGASDMRVAEDNVVELLASNIPFNTKAYASEAPKPGFGMLMLYGVKDTLAELSRWRMYAREIGASMATAEIEVQIGYMEPLLIKREWLRERKDAMQFANLRRMVADLQEDILGLFNKYDETSGEEDSKRMIKIALHPGYFDRVFQDDEDLGHLKVLVLPVADDPEAVHGGSKDKAAKLRQVAYVRPGVKILSIRQGNTDARIILPRWMTDAAEAARFQQSAA